ncbi:MAG: hypothetical protein AAGG54_07460 [Pseudomonadota bacterium]
MRCPTILALTACLALPAVAQEMPEPPTTSRDQEQVHRHTIPTGWETEIYVSDEEGAARAQMILDLYEVLRTEPTIENVAQFVRPD